jgi:hypothetical protein
MSARNCSATPTQLIVVDSLHVRFYQLVALVPIQEERPSLQILVLSLSLRVSMLVTLKLFVSSVKMQLEAQFNMIIGRFNKQETVEQLWLEPPSHLLMQMSLSNMLMTHLCKLLPQRLQYSSLTLIPLCVELSTLALLKMLAVVMIIQTVTLLSLLLQV